MNRPDHLHRWPDSLSVGRGADHGADHGAFELESVEELREETIGVGLDAGQISQWPADDRIREPATRPVDEDAADAFEPQTICRATPPGGRQGNAGAFAGTEPTHPARVKQACRTSPRKDR